MAYKALAEIVIPGVEAKGVGDRWLRLEDLVAA
jgi:hypothetical protein